MKGWCVRCQAKREMKLPKLVETRYGAFWKSVCTTCGGILWFDASLDKEEK